jgi:2-polyprenyl-3-methyl-5-hydroxy-6-metoxy-1,4-benzoquinol methylase
MKLKKGTHVYRNNSCIEEIMPLFPHHDVLNEACYNNQASHWDRFPYPSSLPCFIEKYDPKIGKKVLDIGSGVGVLAEYLQNKGFDVECIDPSIEMVRRTTTKGLKTTQARIQDFTTSSQYSMVFAILSLIHVPKKEFEMQIQKIASFLPSKGVFFLGLLEGAGEKISSDEYPRFFSYYMREEVEKKIFPYFKELDYSYHCSQGFGYMLFVLQVP